MNRSAQPFIAPGLHGATDILRWCDARCDAQGHPLHPRTARPACRFGSAEQAEALLRRRFTATEGCRWRALLDGVGVRPMPDHELLRQLAHRLADGRLLMFEGGSEPVAVPLSRGTVARGDGSGSASTPSVLRGRPAAPAPQDVVAAAPAGDELLAGTDQLAQAAALVLAAARESPFCEVCEQRRRAA